ncbi:MAG TPA: GNAT family N-acetyltransferase [Ornithinibacter sp.]|nr:GNAT family N-acetyltransferase [Ornithinibacter sp.]
MPSASPRDPRVRPAVTADVPVILRLVRELAEYEKALHEVDASGEHLREALFPTGREPAAFAHVAEVDGEVVGCAIWFLSFSTWTGTHGIWLEDLYVTPARRGSGLGQELLRTLAEICVARGYHRLEWWVLDWNTPSIGFYESIGAVAQDEWTRFRLDGAALDTLAETAPPPSAPGSRRL